MFKNIDILATPTCGQTAEPILDSDNAAGTWNLKATMMSMLYVKLGNFTGKMLIFFQPRPQKTIHTGVPAISVPSGYNENGLPTGLMLHSKWYDEEKLLKVAYQMDHKVNRLRPKVYYEM